MRLILPKIVNEKQSGFVAGRMITDNKIVANEVMHWMKGKRKGKCGFATQKIDIAKAYDRMEWNYLEGVLVALGFCRKWVDLVMMCV